jgi:DNA polymerase-3 subunit delta
MQEAQKIIKSIQSGQFAPIYFLHGEEAYYIDLIANLIEGTALDELQKALIRQYCTVRRYALGM